MVPEIFLAAGYNSGRTNIDSIKVVPEISLAAMVAEQPTHLGSYPNGLPPSQRATPCGATSLATERPCREENAATQNDRPKCEYV